MRIVLVEPDVVLGRIYRLALAADGHQVVHVGTAQAAIHATDEQRPDLVLLELQLVSHSGIEFLYELRSYNDWQDIPVVVLSHVPWAEFGQSRELLRDQLGVVAHHYKPQTSLTMLRRIVASQPAPAVS